MRVGACEYVCECVYVYVFSATKLELLYYISLLFESTAVAALALYEKT